MENFDYISYIVIPLLIFTARVIDVTIGTVRIILISRGNKVAAPLMGFVEVLIWLAAISQVMKNLQNVVSYLAYGAGFATGSYVGIILEKKMAIGLQAVRIITNNTLHSLPMILRHEGFAVTTVDATGAKGPVNIIYTVVNRKNVKHVLDLAKIFEPGAFITIEDIRTSYAGFFKDRPPFRVAKKK